MLEIKIKRTYKVLGHGLKSLEIKFTILKTNSFDKKTLAQNFNLKNKMLIDIDTLINILYKI